MAKYRIPSDYKNDTSRAVHNWSSPAGGTIHCGLAYPTHFRHLNAKERVRGSIKSLLQSHPMEGPLLNGFKLTTFGVFLPDSVIYSWMRNGMFLRNSNAYLNFRRLYFDPTSVGKIRKTDGTTSYYGLARGLTSYKNWINDTRTTVGDLHDHVGRGGLWEWLGVPAGTVAPALGTTSSSGVVNVLSSASVKWDIAPFVTYLLACYYYILNVQEGDFYCTKPLDFFSISTDESIGEQPTLSDLPFSELMVKVKSTEIMGFIGRLQEFTAKGDVTDADLFKLFAAGTAPQEADVFAMLCHGIGAHGGLVPVPYSPDLFGNIIKVGESPSAVIPVDYDDYGVSDTGSVVAVPKLRFQTKIQNALDRLFVSGGRFSDMLRTLWGSDSNVDINKPDFVGVWQASINPSNVTAMASGSASGLQVNLAQKAASLDRFVSHDGSQGVDYYAKEPGTLMFITMLVPDPAYTQGLHPDLVARRFSDDFNPEMNGIGFTSVPRHRFSTLPASFTAAPWVTSSAPSSNVDPNIVTVGEEVAWSWLRTDYPRLHGEFAQNGVFQYWTLVRRFTEYYERVNAQGEFESVDIGEYFGTYVNPLSWQYLFASTSFADPNFVLLCDFDLTVTSAVSASYMPFLGR